jgi:hypothetical protein
MKRKSGGYDVAVIQGPHCILDFELDPYELSVVDADYARELVNQLNEALNMEPMGEVRIIQNEDGDLSIYQIVTTSHIIIHFGASGINADLFSCEPFDVGQCANLMINRFGTKASIQYCQRNLTRAPKNSAAIPMGHMNALTSNPDTFTHALVNWFGGDEKLLADVDHGTAVLQEAVQLLHETGHSPLPHSEVALEKVDPIPDSWDKGGFSGGYINLRRQLTMHTFLGLNAAYSDIMGYTFDLQAILKTIQQGFGFSFYEVDAIFQRKKMD